MKQIIVKKMLFMAFAFLATMGMPLSIKASQCPCGPGCQCGPDCKTNCKCGPNCACNNAPVKACADSCSCWSIISDSLYWTACERGLTYGSETEAISFGTGGTLTQFNTKVKNPHQRWDFGWRLGVGYRSPCDCWDAKLIWTSYYTDPHARHDEDVTGARWFTPAWGGTPGTGTPGGALMGGNLVDTEGAFPVVEASSHWKLSLNLVDLEIGRDFCVDSCLTLRPFVGVRFASINEKYKLTYDATTVVIDELAAPEPGAVVAGPFDPIHLKNNFEGAGVRGGLETDYDIGCGFSLYGTLAASLLYGETEIKSRQRLIVASLTPATSLVEHEQKDEQCGCRAITDACIGIRWLRCCCGKTIITKLGWEHHFFFSENQFESFTDFDGTDNALTYRNPQIKRGDLSVQGIVLSSTICF